MEYAGDQWVRHLRDGTTPHAWRSILGLSILILGTAAVLVAELTRPGFLVYAFSGHRRASFFLLPLLLLGIGVYLAISSRIRSKSDRRALVMIRASSTPAFYLPVVGSSSDVESGSGTDRVVMWTVDRDGLHAWTLRSKTPAHTIPWSSLTTITLAEQWNSRVGMDQAYGLALELDDKTTVILRCRSTIGRSYPASATKLDILMRVLRSLRRELDRVEPA